MMTTTTKKKNTKTTRRNIEIISAEEGRIKCIMCKCNASHANIKTRISNKSFFAHVQLILFPRTYSFRHNNINVAVYYSHWTVIFSQSVIQWSNFCTHSMVDEQVDEWVRVSEYTIASEWAFNATPITIVVVADFLAVIHIRALNFPPSTTTHYYSLYPAIQSESTPVLSWVVFNKINRRADILQFRFSINRNRYATERTIQYYEVQHFPFCLILIVELCSFVARMVRQTLHEGRVLCRYCTGKSEVRLINY